MARCRRSPTGEADPADNPLKHAPHTAAVVCADEWDHAYSREPAAFPAPWTREQQVLARRGPGRQRLRGPATSICSCAGMEAYAAQVSRGILIQYENHPPPHPRRPCLCRTAARRVCPGDRRRYPRRIPGHRPGRQAGQATGAARAAQHPGDRPQLQEACRGGRQGRSGAADAFPQGHEHPTEPGRSDRDPGQAREHRGRLRVRDCGRHRQAMQERDPGQRARLTFSATPAPTMCRPATGSSVWAAASSARARASTPSAPSGPCW